MANSLRWRVLPLLALDIYALRPYLRDVCSPFRSTTHCTCRSLLIPQKRDTFVRPCSPILPVLNTSRSRMSQSKAFKIHIYIYYLIRSARARLMWKGEFAQNFNIWVYSSVRIWSLMAKSKKIPERNRISVNKMDSYGKEKKCFGFYTGVLWMVLLLSECTFDLFIFKSASNRIYLYQILCLE